MHLFQGPRPFKASPGNRIGAIKGNTFANLLLVQAATIHDGMVSGITGKNRLEHGGRGIGKRRDKVLWCEAPAARAILLGAGFIIGSALRTCSGCNINV